MYGMNRGIRTAALLLGILIFLSGCKAEKEQVETLLTETADSVETTQTQTLETVEEDPDTEAPFFLKTTPRVTLERGGVFDVHRYVSYIDDLDPHVDLMINGEVETETPGEYPLELILEDDSGKTASFQMTVTVVEPEPSGPSGKPQTSTPAATRIRFDEFAARYLTEETMVGIDVSKWQGDVDFEKAAAAGCQFVIIRLGGFSDGVFEDRYFADNIRNAKNAGLKVGVYWYSEEAGADMVRENAETLYTVLGGETLDFPIFFDWEDFNHFDNYEMSKRDLNEMFLAFREEARARGYEAALYGSKYYLNEVWSPRITSDGVWLAHYVDETNYEGEYFLWQQGYGRIDGIAGDVDVDVFYPAKLF